MENITKNNTLVVGGGRLSPEDLFLKEIKLAIKNLLIDNPNYYTDYYNGNFFNLVSDTQKRAQSILEYIDEIDHLVKFYPEHKSLHNGNV